MIMRQKCTKRKLLDEEALIEINHKPRKNVNDCLIVCKSLSKLLPNTQVLSKP